MIDRSDSIASGPLITTHSRQTRATIDGLKSVVDGASRLATSKNVRHKRAIGRRDAMDAKSGYQLTKSVPAGLTPVTP